MKINQVIDIEKVLQEKETMQKHLSENMDMNLAFLFF